MRVRLLLGNLGTLFGIGKKCISILFFIVLLVVFIQHHTQITSHHAIAIHDEKRERASDI